MRRVDQNRVFVRNDNGRNGQDRSGLGVQPGGADGVALARQEKPDMVLMDIVMPGLNGFQATRQLTKDSETSHIPVIVVTTKDQETDMVWAQRQGAKGYLTKPVDEEQLILKVKKVLEENPPK